MNRNRIDRRSDRGMLYCAFFWMAWAAMAIPSAGIANMHPVREPVVAGRFYPADPQELRGFVEASLAKAQKMPLSGRLVSLLAPHAGYIYSGEVAAWAYRQIEGRVIDTVVVIAPSHQIPFRGVSVPTSGAYRTPLGLVPIHEKACKDLVNAHELIREFPAAHGPEHALEVQLPFLQMVLEKEWHLIPVIMGHQDLETARVLTEALQPVLQRSRTLVVVSSDLSHYHSGDRATQMDRSAIRHMEELNPEALWDDIRNGKVEACGGGPILAALFLARQLGVQEGKLLKYAHSGDITGDFSRVVGYAALVWAAEPKGAGKEESAVGDQLGLSQEEKETLKKIARTTIQCCLEGKTPPRDIEGITPVLREPRGAFVTLEKQGRLRGCIGFIEALKPLYQTVQEMSESAAFRDPRFPALRAKEWPDIDVEISVLTPLTEIRHHSEIQVGKHGLYIVKGPYRGLLLPQVAVEYNWDRETFLAHTCTKAGLPKDAWNDPEARIYIFSCEIF